MIMVFIVILDDDSSDRTILSRYVLRDKACLLILVHQ